ncbi:peptidoglycan D,D-transpeptidase FtsI family protein [Bifidobacterium bombi]|uniref:Penicillin-binding protein transpeptidase domain n=1 Tax=Bifidobacterium bombi DSM 19703 TaxID=1341695 RepID=A0A086BPA6_9BIFI|nr:penicillin-binding protein 2 [Bifidobacterium bombi]KFF31770.1 penicillin-binding protein transpeptidase domain [Bifidobacterium bombi DSM 19703]
MNKYLRQLFTVVLALFVIIAFSSSWISVISADKYTSDPRNVRAYELSVSSPRGSILASDGTVMAKSNPVNDTFAYQREYADGPLYAPVTGYFSINQAADRGIEASRNKPLTDESNAMFWKRLRATVEGSKNNGASIETSIDPVLQKTAYDGLTASGKDGGAVAIEVKTGRILAMVSSPSYDPNLLASHNSTEVNRNYTQLTSGDSSPMVNRTTSQLYPPGSTFKTVVATAALASGKYQPDTQIPAGASYTLPGTSTQLTNSTPAAAGVDGHISFEDALAYSSNTAFAQLAGALGGDAVATQAKKFGYGSPITIDGTDSSGMPMTAVASKFPSSPAPDKLALSAIGQGDVQSTVLQNAMVAQAIANEGKMMKPTLVDRVRASDLSTISRTHPSVKANVMSSDASGKLTGMMKSVVTKENANLALPGIQVAAKTGTAQIGVGNSSIDGWVIGFAPADDPQIAVAVLVHNTDVLGSFAAGPIMRSMMQEALEK